jgi:hypothetical protein
VSTLLFACLISALMTGWAIALLVWLGEIPGDAASDTELTLANDRPSNTGYGGHARSGWIAGKIKC